MPYTIQPHYIKKRIKKNGLEPGKIEKELKCSSIFAFWRWASFWSHFEMKMKVMMPGSESGSHLNCSPMPSGFPPSGHMQDCTSWCTWVRSCVRLVPLVSWSVHGGSMYHFWAAALLSQVPSQSIVDIYNEKNPNFLLFLATESWGLMVVIVCASLSKWYTQ